MLRGPVLAQSLLSIVLASIPLDARVIHVDPTGLGEFTEIQPALDDAEDGDTVLVEPAEYLLREPLDFNRLHDPGDPDEGVPPRGPPVKNLTLSGRGGSSVTVLRMAEPDDPKRASVVLFRCDEGPGSVLTGFTLTGGRGTLVDAGSLQAQISGGGIGCFRGSPTIQSCVIAGNQADTGGGLVCQVGSPRVRSCEIVENRASIGGGAFFSGAGAPEILDCDIHHNEEGGVAVSYPGMFLSMTSTRIFRNRKDADSGGGAGVQVFDSSVRLEGCVLYKNEAWASGEGGALQIYNSSASLVNCTVVGNRADASGGGIQVCGSLRLLNSIVIGNGEDLHLDPYSECASVLDASHCLLSDPDMGEDCFEGDPRFVDPAILDFAEAGGDWHLLPDSPAIDMGTNEGSMAADIDGDLRPCSRSVDVGADETCPTNDFVRGDANDDGTIDITDAIFTLDYLFLGSTIPPCEDAADVDDDGEVSLSDAIRGLLWLFQGGEAPPAPWPEKGRDSTEDELGCLR